MASPMEFDGEVILRGGDGDPDFFSKPRVLTAVSEEWFSGRLKFGAALLFRLKDGDAAMAYALTSRNVSSVASQLLEQGWANVVVHRIENPSRSFQEERDSLAIGMSIAEHIV